MHNTTAKKLFEALLYKDNLCTLATVSPDGKPEAATIQYYADKKYCLYFESFPDYRKYQNIKMNPRASIVITHGGQTVQMDGIVEELSGKDAAWAKQKLIESEGKGVGYLHAPDVLFFRFTPTWIRVLVDGSYPPRYEVVLEK